MKKALLFLNTLLLVSTFLPNGVLLTPNANSETLALTTERISGRVKNIIDGYVSDADVYVGDTKVGKTDNYGVFKVEVDDSHLNQNLKIVAPGYETFLYPIDSRSKEDLGTVSLDYTYQYFGETRYKSFPDYNNWKAYSTRGLDSIKIKFSSPYQRFAGSNSEINFFVDTGDVLNTLSAGDYNFKLRADQKLFIYDFGRVHETIYPSIFNYQVVEHDGGTDVFIDLPYSFLKIDYTEVIGVCFIDHLKGSNTIADFSFDGDTISTNNLTKYTRLDKKGKAFTNTVNNANPTWISKIVKAQLIEGYDYFFADSTTSSSQEADNVYFKFQYLESGLSMQFIGFGYFDINEYFKLVIHSNEYAYFGWALGQDTMVLHIARNGISYYRNSTNFFDVELSHKTPSYVSNVTYRDMETYFTVDCLIDWELLPNIQARSQGFKMAIAEFGNNLLYAPNDATDYIRYQGQKMGDIAGMFDYIAVQSPFDTITISNEDKSTLTADARISFANPKDTYIDEADDIYVLSSRNSSGYTFKFTGFGNFQVYETIKVVLHNSAHTNGINWNINSQDVSLLINRNRVLLKTNSTWFFDLNVMASNANVSVATPSYVRYENYFELSVTIPYSELGNFTESTAVNAMFIEMDFLGQIYNGGLYSDQMRYNGVATGDPARQTSYRDLFN